MGRTKNGHSRSERERKSSSLDLRKGRGNKFALKRIYNDPDGVSGGGDSSERHPRIIAHSTTNQYNCSICCCCHSLLLPQDSSAANNCMCNNNCYWYCSFHYYTCPYILFRLVIISSKQPPCLSPSVPSPGGLVAESSAHPTFID